MSGKKTKGRAGYHVEVKQCHAVRRRKEKGKTAWPCRKWVKNKG